MGIMKRILNVADAVTPDFLTDPLLDIGGDIVRPWMEDGVTIGDPFRSIFSLVDAPRKVITSGMGELGYRGANLGNAMGIRDDDDPELLAIRKAYEEGGSRGVWEEFASDKSMAERAAMDIAMDPLTYAGGAFLRLGKMNQALDAAGNTGVMRKVLGGAEKTAGVLNAPDRLVFDPAAMKAARGIRIGSDKVGLSSQLKKVGNTKVAQKVRFKISDLKELGDYAKMQHKIEKIGDDISDLLKGRNKINSMEGFLDARQGRPINPNFGHVDNAERNLFDINAPSDPAQDLAIRRDTSGPLGMTLEDRTARLWRERNVKAETRLRNKIMGTSQHDASVPRSNRGLDTAEPFVRERTGPEPGVRPDGPIQPIMPEENISALQAMGKKEWDAMAQDAAFEIEKNMADPDFFGSSWAMDPSGKIVPLGDDPTASRGFPVSLTSAGENGVLKHGDPNTAFEIYKTINKYEPLLKSGDAYIGAFRINPEDGTYSFDININAHSVDEADAIAEATNQIAWFDPITMESITPFGGALNSDSPFKSVDEVMKFKGVVDEARASGKPLHTVMREAGYENYQPLKSRDIKDEINFNTQEELKKLRTKKTSETLANNQSTTEAMSRSSGLSRMSDDEWNLLATVVDDELAGFSQTIPDGGQKAIYLDAKDGFAEVEDFAGFRVNINTIGEFPVGEGGRRSIAKAIQDYRDVLQDPDMYIDVARQGDTYRVSIATDALTREEAQLIGAITSQPSYLDPEAGSAGLRQEVYHGKKDGASQFNTPLDVQDLKEAIDDARIGEGSLLENIKRGFDVPEAAFAPEPIGPNLVDGVSAIEPEPGLLARGVGKIEDGIQRLESKVPGAGRIDNLIDGPETVGFEQRNLRKNFETKDEFQTRTLSLKALNENVKGVGLRRTIDDYRRGMRRNPSNIEARASSDYFLETAIDPLEDTDGYISFLSEDANKDLFGVTMKDGASVGAYSMHTFDEIEADKALFRKAGIEWTQLEATKASDEVAKKFKDQIESALTPDEQKLLKKRLKVWDKLGLSPDIDSVDGTRGVVMQKMMVDSGVKNPYSTKYSRARSIWSATALTSPRYIISNLTTNVMDAIISGHMRFDAYPDFWAFSKAELRRTDMVDFLPGTKTEEYFQKWGMTSDYSIHNRTQRNLTGGRTKGKSEIRELMEKLKIGPLSTVVDGSLALAQGLDTVGRASMAIDVFENVAARETPQLLGKIDGILQKTGVDMMGREYLPNMDPAYILSYYRGIGVPDGYAQRISREVAEVKNMARKEARTEIERVFLSYRKTKADDIVAKFVPFHYWASRKFVWYAEEAYRNPVLLANYGRAIQGIENAQNDPGLNARQKGFLRLMAGPTGFTLLMNPEAMMGVIRASQLTSTYTPDGETEMGGILGKLKQYGIGLYPWIDGFSNMIGMQGDTFEPDMIGIRHRGIIGAVINHMRGQGWLGEGAQQPGASPYAELNDAAREKISTWVASFTPEWFAQPVEKGTKTIGDASLETIIQSRIIEKNPELTNSELIALMNDPDSDAYREAYREAAQAGVISQLLSFTLPATFRVKENAKDVRAAATREVTKAAERMGMNPWEFTESDADAEFRASYKRQTGKEFSDVDYKNSQFQKSLIIAANPSARNFLLAEQEYRQIGAGRAQKVSQEYSNLRNGSDPRTMGMTAEQRNQYAKDWANRTGAMPLLEEMWTLQRAYKETHPEFGRYKEWQSQMYNLQAQYGGSLAEYRRLVSQQNPSAATYFANEERRLLGSGIAPEDIAAEMDRITVNPNAWFAINALERTVYDEDRNAHTGGMGDPLFSAQAPFVKQSYVDPMSSTQKLAQNDQNGAYWQQALRNRGL